MVESDGALLAAIEHPFHAGKRRDMWRPLDQSGFAT
jgi:hypothetical protein